MEQDSICFAVEFTEKPSAVVPSSLAGISIFSFLYAINKDVNCDNAKSQLLKD